MSNGDAEQGTRPPDFRVVVEGILAGVLSPDSKQGTTAYLLEIAARIIGLLVAIPLSLFSYGAAYVARFLIKAETFSEPAFQELSATAIEDIYGVRINPSDLAQSARGGRRRAVGDVVGRAILQTIAGGRYDAAGSTLAPSVAPAEDYVGKVTGMAIEGWAESWLFELASAGFATKLGDLDDTLNAALGIGRISRRVISPLVDAKVVTPFRWTLNKSFRPELLSPGDAVRHYLRGRWTREQLDEELARQGYDAERIAAIVSNQTKRLSIDHLLFLFDRGVISDTDVVGRAQDLGYDAETAKTLVEIARTEDRDRYLAPIVNEAVSAYINHDLDDAEAQQIIRGAAPSSHAADMIFAAARARRGLRVRRLSAAQVAGMVEDQILTFRDYREALQREGYADVDIAALELSLRHRIDAAAELAALREQQRIDREQERAEAKAKREARERDLEERRARTFPTIAEYRRAYVRGYVDRETYIAALTREKYSPDDQAFLIADADNERDEYLADLAAAEAAAHRDTGADLSIAALEQAVERNIITIDQYRADLARRKFDEGEVAVLSRILEQRIADRVDAAKRRDEAAARAERAAIPLSDFERAVRLGVRTLDEYAAYLAAIDTPEVSRALILDLLRAQMRADELARQRRDDAAARAAVKGISLEQRARAVIRGLRPLEYYAAALVEAGVPVDDQQVLIDLVDAAAADAAAARARRNQIEQTIDDPTLSLAQVERAVRLGIFAPDDLRRYLLDRGYSTADADVIVEIAVAAIPDLRAGANRRDTITAELAAKGISLGDYERAVKRGIRTIDEYAALLTEQGYGADDVDLLRQLLAEEIAVDIEGTRARIAAKLAKTEGAPDLAAIVAPFDAGTISVDQLVAALVAAGAGGDEALVFARLYAVYGPQG